jgi:hypothetical protein
VPRGRRNHKGVALDIFLFTAVKEASVPKRVHRDPARDQVSHQTKVAFAGGFQERLTTEVECSPDAMHIFIGIAERLGLSGVELARVANDHRFHRALCVIDR